MSVFRRRDQQEEAPPKAVMAAAMPLAGPDVRRVATVLNKGRVEGWQADAWYFYDAIGELRAPINWISNAVSQASPFAAETDPETGLVTGPTEDTRVQRVASQLLGGTAHRAQLQYILAVCWQVPGEAFIIIRPRPLVRGVRQPDEWLILSGDKVKQKGGSWTYTDPQTMLPVTLGNTDRLIRVWSPHPRDQAMADTAVRPALPTLREIEKSSMNIAARLDSRLAGNGILAIPQEINFPTKDGESQASAVTAYLMEAMEASLSNPGTAGAQVPIIIEIPSELIDSFKNGHLDLSTDFDASVVELRDNGLSRLASTLDMPNETAEGSTGGMNHWGAWQVEESTYKIYIEPLLQRLGDALTTYWFHPALRAMGITDPERYVIDWDTSSIVKRPDSTEDLNWLYDHRLISDDFRRAESGIPDDGIPSVDEVQRRLLVDVVTAAPTLAADPQIGQELFGFEVAPAAAGISQAELDGETPEPAAAPQDSGARALPAGQDAAQADDVDPGLVAAAGLVVKDALSRAGGRLLTREYRGEFASTPKHALYLSIPHGDEDTSRLLEGSFQFVEDVAQAYGRDPKALTATLRSYTENLIDNRSVHDPRALAFWISR